MRPEPSAAKLRFEASEHLARSGLGARKRGAPEFKRTESVMAVFVFLLSFRVGPSVP